MEAAAKRQTTAYDGCEDFDAEDLRRLRDLRREAASIADSDLWIFQMIYLECPRHCVNTTLSCSVLIGIDLFGVFVIEQLEGEIEGRPRRIRSSHPHLDSAVIEAGRRIHEKMQQGFRYVR